MFCHLKWQNESALSRWFLFYQFYKKFISADFEPVEDGYLAIVLKSASNLLIYVL